MKACFSLRRLSTTYTGATVNVRRGSDNVTMDFYGNTQGNALGSSLDAGGTQIVSWLGGATGFVTTWYDQSGVGANATQTTTGNQPSINTTGWYIDFRTHKRLNLPNSTLTSGNNKFTCVVRHGATRAAAGPCFVSGGAQTSPQSMILQRGNTGGNAYAVAVWATYDLHSGASTYQDNSVAAWQYTQSNFIFFRNGTQLSSQSMSSINVAAGNNRIGTWGGSGTDNSAYGLDGDLYNIFIFNTDISSTDRNVCESI